MKRALLIAGGTVGGLGAVLSMTPPHLGVAATSVNALATGVTTTDAPQTVDPSTTPVSSPSTATPTAAQTNTPTSSASSPASASASATASASKTAKASTTSPRATKSTTTSVATKKATSAPSATKTTAASTPTTSTSASAPATQTPTPTPTKTTATPTPTPTPTPPPAASGVSGTFTGGTFDAAQNNNLWGRVTVTVTLKNGEISNISAIQNPSSRSYGAFTYLTPAVLTQKLSAKTVMSITPTSLVSQIRGYTGASYSSFAYWQSLQSALSKAGF